MTAQSPRGLDLDRFTAYFSHACPGQAQGPLSATLIAGGRSNLTYIVSDGVDSWVVRRPPLGHVLATAHDMAREYRVITALGPTPVPVPRTYVLCEDVEVIGAPFYVMQHVRGASYRYASELLPLGPDRTHEIGVRMVRTLAALHSVDPLAVGLADFGRPEGFLQRQVRRWGQQLDASHSRDLAGADELRALLAANVPPEQPPAIVHGDYRLDNVLVDDADDVTAVLDWEMATIGDPITDLALLLVYQRMMGALQGLGDAPLAPGFITEEEIIAVYAESSGRDLTDMGFYIALASFKLAVILEGIHFRFAQGQTVGDGFDLIGPAVEPLIASGLAALRPTS